jgi:hypothetical protein
MGGATSGGGALLLGFALVIIGSILVKAGGKKEGWDPSKKAIDSHKAWEEAGKQRRRDPNWKGP